MTRRPRQNPIDRALFARLSSGDTSGPFPPPTLTVKAPFSQGETPYASCYDALFYDPLPGMRPLSIPQEIDKEFSLDLRALFDPPDPDPRAAIRRIIRESIARPHKPPCR